MISSRNWSFWCSELPLFLWLVIHVVFWGSWWVTSKLCIASNGVSPCSRVPRCFLYFFSYRLRAEWVIYVCRTIYETVHLSPGLINSPKYEHRTLHRTCLPKTRNWMMQMKRSASKVMIGKPNRVVIEKVVMIHPSQSHHYLSVLDFLSFVYFIKLEHEWLQYYDSLENSNFLRKSSMILSFV